MVRDMIYLFDQNIVDQITSHYGFVLINKIGRNYIEYEGWMES